jgi:putative transposase
MGQEYRRKETCVFLMNYHVVFCPKRRRKILVGAIRDRLMMIIWETAPDLECDVLAMEVMPDHVHLFLSAAPQWAPNQLIGRIKRGVTESL